MNKFIHIRSAKFPVLLGEKEELVNEGMYGKALAEYLQAKLRDRGYDAPFICCEDWGWWVELRAPFTFGVCISAGLKETDRLTFTARMEPRRGRNGTGGNFDSLTPHLT